MIRKISEILLGMLFLTGLGILCYPTLSDQWNTYRQNQLITTYEEAVAVLEPEDYTREWDAAQDFNRQITQNSLYGDVFGEAGEEMEDTAYWKVLNPSGDGVMGYLSIPKIDLKLSLYHGTGEEVLQTGVGHLSGMGLPIGGSGNHSVLAAHRGLPSAALFTDLDKLQEGDTFYLSVLDDTLCYEVDLITVVDPTETEALAAQEGEDLVTLLTCTPYGVNSHRLLVRGHRIPYMELGEDAIPAASGSGLVGPSMHTSYLLWVIIGLAVTVLFITLLYLYDRRKRKAASAGRKP